MQSEYNFVIIITKGNLLWSKKFQIIFFFQVRRSFLEELGIHENWTVVDMIFREFYMGSDEDLTPSERQILTTLFETQFYVEREIEYSYTSSLGSVNKTALQNWKGYLKKVSLSYFE